MNITKLFGKPKIVAIIADVNQGKSMVGYHIIEELKKKYTFKLYSYGLRADLGERKINSVEELEKIKNSFIVVDEYFSLFDLTDRKKRRMIEKTLRLINHNNNILILIGLPENFKKFIAAKCDMVIYKQCSLADFINGSRVKEICTSYKGNELGSAILDVPIDKALIYDGQHYEMVDIPYLEKYDSKKKNQPILSVHKKVVVKSKNRGEKVQKKVEK